MKYLARLEYNGKNYCGWQRQLNAISIQHCLEQALEGLFGKKTPATASGRTDSGVHAIGQAVSFEADTTIPPASLVHAINARLPADIRLKSCQTAPDDFSARFSAKRKTYLYKAYVSDTQSALRRDFYAQIMPPFDTKLVAETAQMLAGTHDFSAFCAAGSEVQSTVRTIYDISVEARGDEVWFRVCGNGFLYNMVRIIVGTLAEIGQHKLPKEVINQMLCSGKRELGGKTYPPQGLYLESVEYD